MAGEDIPRRMRRFYRNKPTEREVRDKSSEIAIDNVDKFREKHNRYPNRDELEDISKDVFEQLKRDLKKEESEVDDIDLGPEPKSGKGAEKKSILDLRREKRGQAGKGTTGEQEKKQEGKKPTRSELRKQARKDSEKKNNEEEGTGEETGEEAGLESEEGDEIDAGELGGEEESTEELEKEENRAGVKALANVDELSQLENELSGEGEEGEEEFDLVEKEVDTGMNSCPNCGSKALAIIYCPECGVAFCDNCAKKVEVLSDAVKYTCPKCGAEFKSRKPKK